MNKTYLGSLNQALFDLLSNDKSVYILGEDILDPYGGAFKVTKGLSTKYPDRVIPTPISEASMIGIALGMAMQGLKPIVEIMFGDFITLGADQIINHASKFAKMYSGKMSLPLVIRTPMGGNRGYGPTHSQTLEKIFLGIPNVDVVSPSHFHSPSEILKKVVLKNSNPTLFIEHKLLYAKKLIREDTDFLYHHEIKSAKEKYPSIVVKNYEDNKPDIILVTYGGNSRLIESVMREMFEEEIQVCSYLPSDLNNFYIEPIKKEIESCKKIITIEEGTKGFDWGAEISSQIYSNFENIDLHIERIAADKSILPASRELEKNILPSEQKISEKIFEVLI